MLKDELPAGRILDVGAGTGILTGQLQRAGLKLWSCDPSMPMLEQLRLSLPDVPAVCSSAEELPFNSRTFTAMVVAQAFHWFDPAQVLDEFDRVLIDDAILAVVWNLRDESVDWVRNLTDLIEFRSGGRPLDAAVAIESYKAVESSGLFEPHLSQSFDNPQNLNMDLLASRVRSTSFVAAMPLDSQSELVSEALALVGESADPTGSGQFEYPHRTEVSIFRKT